MNLKMKWPLQSTEDSTGTPSGASPVADAGAPPATAPASAPAVVDLPDTGQQGHETDDVTSDEPVIDWHAESEPAPDLPDEPDEPAPPAPPPAPPAKTPPAPPPAPPTAATPPAPVEQQPPPPAEATPPAAAETPEQKQARELEEQKAREKAEQEFEAQLTEYYKIPDDLAARLATEPEVVLPTLAVKVHQAVLRAATKMMAEQLPIQIQQIQAIQKANQESHDAFYAKWPQLKGHEKHVLQVGRMYRQMNPTAEADVAIDKIGRVVIAALGLTEQAPAAGGTPPAKPPPPPAARAGFRPAGTQAAAAAATPPADNIFAQLAEEFLQEDAQQ